MDPATQIQITGLLYTLVLPVGAAALVLFASHKLRPGNPLGGGLAVIAGLIVAALGIGGSPSSPLDADDWLLIGPAVSGLLALGFDGFGDRLGRARLWLIGLLGAALLAFFGWRIAGSLASLWSDGYGPLAASAWVIDALAVGWLIWIALHGRVAAAEPGEEPVRSPIVLGPLALALVGAALATALTGSARIGQMFGGFAAVVGAVGLAGWRWPALKIGAGAVAAALAALVLGLLYAHHFVEVPRPVALLLMLAPLGAVVGLAAGRAFGRTLPAVGVALGVTAAVVGAAAGLTGLNEQVKAAAAASDDGDDGGVYAPY